MAEAALSTRRAVLKSIPACGLAAIVPTAAVAVEMHPVDRFHAAVAELKAAAEALDPNIYQWTINTNGEKQCGLLVAAFRMTTKYEGDGWYHSPHEWSEVKRVLVKRAPEHDAKGERWFRVTPFPATSNRNSVLMAEEHFRTNYGPRITEI